MGTFKSWTDAEVAWHNAQVAAGKGVAPAPTGEGVEKEGVDDESELARDIEAHCNKQWPKWKFIRARSDQKSTIAVGAQDYTIFLPHGKTLCCELKSKTGKLSTEQLGWHKEMEMLGHKVHVLRSMDDFRIAMRSDKEGPVQPNQATGE